MASAERTDRLLRYKVMNAIASSELAERLVLRMLKDPDTPKEQQRLRDRLLRAGERWQQGLERIRWQSFCPPQGGLFSWVRLPAPHQDALPLSEAALAEGLLLAPGSQFRVDAPPTPWLRCNLAYSHQPLLDFLQGWARRQEGA